MTKLELAQLLESFIDGTCGRWEWDDFTSIRQKDPEIEKWRQELTLFDEKYPRRVATEFCNSEGSDEMLRIAKLLREEFALKS